MAAIGEWGLDHLGTLVLAFALFSMIFSGRKMPVKFYSIGTLIAFAALVVWNGFFESYHLVWGAQYRVTTGLLVVIPYAILFIRDSLLWKRWREQNILGWHR